MTPEPFEHSPHGVARISSDGVICWANRALARLFRATPDELAGRRWAALIAPQHRSAEEAQLAELIDLRRTNSEGTTVLDVDRSRVAIARWRAAGDVFVSLQRADDLEAMASIVAHEVRNPLAGIIGGLQVIGGGLAEGSSERDIVRVMVDRLRSLDRSVDDLLAFARPSLPDRAPTEIRGLLEATARVLTMDPDRAGIRVEIAGAAVTVNADADLLGRVFLNLLINAAQALKGRGTIQVNVSEVSSSCRIEVHDSGSGVPPDVRPRIFEPFFTTKNKGTGVGLAVARRSVEAHGGTITLADSVAHGTTFVVELPLV